MITNTVQCELETHVSATETETPEAEIPRPSRFALSSLEIAESAVAISEPAPESPSTLVEALDRIRALNAAPLASDATGRKAHAKLLEIARADHHRLAQGPRAPAVDHATFWKREPPPSALEHIAGLYPKTKARKV